MSVELFHREVDFFDLTRLRARARTEVEGSDLIRRAGSGDRQAAIALHVGFWPFVREFELAIDRRTLPRQPLRSKFGRPSGATAVASINTVLAGLAHEVRNMKEEEGSHAAHWCRDAAECGVASLDAPLMPGVALLIASAYVKELPTFFAVLAGTEFIAEELSAFLVRRKPFVELFERKRWIWGEVHQMPHGDGPSHLEIDLDLARAYAASDLVARPSIEAAIELTIAQFGLAAQEVGNQLNACAAAVG